MPQNKRLWIVYLVGLLLVLGLWHQVFVMTSVLWWNAPPPAERLTALEPINLPPPDISLIDTKAFLETHPEWRP